MGPPKFFVFLILFFLLGGSCSSPPQRVSPPTQQDVIVIRNVHVITMESPHVLNDHAVWVQNGKIQELEPIQNLTFDSTVQVIEGNGNYLLPGLIDMHVHLHEPSDLGLFLASGVTTVRNMRGNQAHLQWRDEVQQGKRIGPTIFTTSPTMDGGNQFSLTFNRVDAPEEAREAVRRYSEAGYDFIKIYSYLNETTFLAIMEEAKQQNIPVVGHAPYQVPMKTILASGVSTLEHVEEVVQGFLGNTFDESQVIQLAKQIKQAEVYYCPTLSAFHNIHLMAEQGDTLLERPEQAYFHPLIIEIETNALERFHALDESQKNHIRQQDQFHRKIVQRFHEEGVSLILGTDAGVRFTLPGASAIQELIWYEDSGLSAYEALKTGTVHAAKALNQWNHRGSLSIGKEADLLMVANNPLNDLSTLQHPVGVMKQGHWFDPNALNQLKEQGKNHMGWLSTMGALFDIYFSK